MTALVEQLTAILGTDGVLVGEAIAARPPGFWRRTPIEARAIVRPRHTRDLSEVLRVCHEARQPVVAHGGLTNPTGSAISRPEDVIIAFERMNAIEEIDPVGRTMVVQAGVTLQAVQEAASEHQLAFPLDLPSRGSCTIGGNIATNAGGARVMRHGMMRGLVLGLEVVLANGDIVSSMDLMLKNNAGYDVKQLFVGSEGTLGIVSRAVLRLSQALPHVETALVAVDDFDQLCRLLAHVEHEVGDMLTAFEVMWEAFYEHVTSSSGAVRPLPLGRPYYVLIETASARLERERFEDALARAEERGLLGAAALARSAAERRAMWAMRDDMGALLRLRPLFGFDVSLPIRCMNDYVRTVQATIAARWPASRTLVFGHLADGNLHFAVAVGDGSPETRKEIEHAVYGPLRAIGGSVSAEHGIGLEKRAYLSWSRSAGEIALMQMLKRTLDPTGILNASKVFVSPEGS